jgi:hypothetical protein
MLMPPPFFLKSNKEFCAARRTANPKRLFTFTVEFYLL